MSLLARTIFFLMIRRPPRSTLDRSSAASDVYKRQVLQDVALRLVEEVALLGANPVVHSRPTVPPQRRTSLRSPRVVRTPRPYWPVVAEYLAQEATCCRRCLGPASPAAR